MKSLIIKIFTIIIIASSSIVYAEHHTKVKQNSFFDKTWKGDFEQIATPKKILFLKHRYFVFENQGKLFDYGYLVISNNKGVTRLNLYGSNGGTAYYDVVEETANSLDLTGKITIDLLGGGPIQVDSTMKLALSHESVKPPVPKTILEAVEYGDINAVKSFLAQGVNINDQDKYGWTALMCAAGYYRPQITSYLLKHKADPNLWSKNKKTALFAAIGANNSVALKELLKYGANLNIKNKDGESPFIVALELGCDLPIVKTLVKNGAQINDHDQYGYPTLVVAINGATTSAYEKVKDGTGITYYGTYSYFPEEKLPIIKYLVEKGAKVNAAQPNGANALTSAAFCGSYSLVEYLLKHGAINVKDGSGYDAVGYVKYWAKESKKQKTGNKIIKLIKNNSVRGKTL